MLIVHAAPRDSDWPPWRAVRCSEFSTLLPPPPLAWPRRSAKAAGKVYFEFESEFEFKFKFEGSGRRCVTVACGLSLHIARPRAVCAPAPPSFGGLLARPTPALPAGVPTSPHSPAPQSRARAPRGAPFSHAPAHNAEASTADCRLSSAASPRDLRLCLRMRARTPPSRASFSRVVLIALVIRALPCLADLAGLAKHRARRGQRAARVHRPARHVPGSLSSAKPSSGRGAHAAAPRFVLARSLVRACLTLSPPPSTAAEHHGRTDARTGGRAAGQRLAGPVPVPVPVPVLVREFGRQRTVR
ncbi:hypothetical protein HETIRDRAFT_106063 [Heterobasidion irregulare TC 32-1]|uniref:Uncharacterized protein n=1 Tax=Heterobasidion irregulare (strain TC 32-1) TaxID=747525 RepID=W4JT39_HETIT|nr:uncharacterized protein HETIRDRAFT_106063 [Heterobasidion irregulare TC 32-1]ETW76624.1 hypothetical protein HETIRDRAFT_106063 [Heterobasidion irregulare TC 32-1]